MRQGHLRAGLDRTATPLGEGEKRRQRWRSHDIGNQRRRLQALHQALRQWQRTFLAGGPVHNLLLAATLGNGCDSGMVSVGRWAGVPTPVAQGLLSIASVVAERDLYAEGRTLENLGLAGLDRERMTELLTKGFQS